MPPTDQCTFSNVTENTVARNRKRVTRRRPGGCARAPRRGVRRSSFVRSSGESGVPWRAPVCQRVCRSRSAASIASASSGATITPASASRTNAAVAPSGGTAAMIGRSAARYSNTFAAITPEPRPGTSGISSRLTSESRWNSSERRRGTYGCSSSRSPRPSPSAHSRSAWRKSPTKRETESGRSARANAVRNGRGSRLPNIAPVCVTRKRPSGRYSSPAKSSKSAPFETTLTSPRAPSARSSSAMKSETATDSSA